MGAETLMRAWSPGRARAAACVAAWSAAALWAGEAAAQAPPPAAPSRPATPPSAATPPPPDAPAPHSEAIARARENFRQGIELTAAGRLADALVAFQTAYDLSPSYRILYNIGQISRHVGDAARSLRAFERYLAEGGAEIDAARRAEVEAEIAALRPRVGAVRVRATAPGAAVLLDGARVGEAPLTGPLYVNPGVHRLRAEHPGKRPAVETLEVAAGQTFDISLHLAPLGPGERERPAPPPVKPRRPTWIAWAVTGTLAAGAAVTGTMALVSAAQLDDARYPGPDRRPPPGSDVDALGARVDALAVATDALALAAVASLGVTLYLTLTEPPADAARPRKTPGAAPRVLVTAGPGIACLRGVF